MSQKTATIKPHFPHPILITVRLSAILLLAATTVIAQDASWELGVRKVPAPEGVSGELHDSIKATAQPDVQARKNGVPKKVFEGMSHADYLAVHDSPGSERLFREIGDFFKAHLTSE